MLNALGDNSSGAGDASNTSDGTGDRKRKKKSRWASTNDGTEGKTFIPGMPTILPSNLNPDQQEAYLGEYKTHSLCFHYYLFNRLNFYIHTSMIFHKEFYFFLLLHCSFLNESENLILYQTFSVLDPQKEMIYFMKRRSQIERKRTDSWNLVFSHNLDKNNKF